MSNQNWRYEESLVEMYVSDYKQFKVHSLEVVLPALYVNNIAYNMILVKGESG